MRISLSFLSLGLALTFAFCLSSVKADDITAADVSELSIDQQILIAVALTNQSETVEPWTKSDLPPAKVEIAHNTSDSTVEVILPSPEGLRKRRAVLVVD